MDVFDATHLGYALLRSRNSGIVVSLIRKDVGGRFESIWTYSTLHTHPRYALLRSRKISHNKNPWSPTASTSGTFEAFRCSDTHFCVTHLIKQMKMLVPMWLQHEKWHTPQNGATCGDRRQDWFVHRNHVNEAGFVVGDQLLLYFYIRRGFRRTWYRKLQKLYPRRRPPWFLDIYGTAMYRERVKDKQNTSPNA